MGKIVPTKFERTPLVLAVLVAPCNFALFAYNIKKTFNLFSFCPSTVSVIKK